MVIRLICNQVMTVQICLLAYEVARLSVKPTVCRTAASAMVVQIYPTAVMGSSNNGNSSLLQSENVGSSPTGSTNAQVVKLGYTLRLGRSAERRGGSTPLLGTNAEVVKLANTISLREIGKPCGFNSRLLHQMRR